MFVEGSAGRVFVEGSIECSLERVPAECWLTEEESEVFTRNSWQTAIAGLEAGAAEPTERPNTISVSISLFLCLPFLVSACLPVCLTLSVYLSVSLR